MKVLFLFYLISLVCPKEDLRFAYGSEQSHDTSCGISVVETLLNLYWGKNIHEQDVVKKLFPQNTTEHYAISLKQIIDIIESNGLYTKGYRFTFNQLKTILTPYAPILVHYHKPYNHYALALSVNGTWVTVLDPARGLELLSSRQFTHRWSQASVLIASAGKQNNRKNTNILDSVKEYSLERIKTLEFWLW